AVKMSARTTWWPLIVVLEPSAGALEGAGAGDTPGAGLVPGAGVPPVTVGMLTRTWNGSRPEKTSVDTRFECDFVVDEGARFGEFAGAAACVDGAGFFDPPPATRRTKPIRATAASGATIMRRRLSRWDSSIFTVLLSGSATCPA